MMRTVKKNDVMYTKIYAEAERRGLDFYKHQGEIEAIARFALELGEESIVPLFDMYTDGLTIGEKEKW